MTDQNFLDIACAEAELGQKNGEIPAGAVLVKDGAVVARSHSRCLELNDPVAVPEMDCIRRAGRRSDQSELVLYTSRHPDMLVAGTILQFSIGAVVVGLPESSTPASELLISRSVPLSYQPHPGCVALGSEI